ncbi:MAG TPA: DEAD/DEAH box helicase [Thermoanaerobaculia bacterium]|nr:DEAD/DEAH box helicase [Thermoanaerobaculia bacterium]
MPFTALGLGPAITKAVREVGYTEPTPIQNKAIPVVLTGRDIIGIAQTGTGKTAAFVLPILQLLSSRGAPMGRRGMRTLIVAPTRELVVQIEENVREYSRHLRFRCATVFGGVGEQPQIRALRAGTEIIVATPGRLIDLMQQGHVDFSLIEIAVLDEADRMLDMGFLPAIRQIVRKLPQNRQTLLFSASLSKEIEALTHEFQKSPQIIQIGRRANPAETVEQYAYEVPKSRKLALLVHLLRDQGLESVLVFSRTKHGADKIARKLVQTGITTATLHSNRSQNQRLAALKAFKSGAVRVLVATDIAARGIDVEGISHVVNFDFPPQPEDYVHRIGRTGRAQAIGDAISFVTPDDAVSLRSLERFISRGIPRKKADGFDLRETFVEESRAPRVVTSPAARPQRAFQPRGRRMRSR